MKSKFFALLLSVFLIPTMLSANWNDACCDEGYSNYKNESCCLPDWSAEFRVGALIPLSDSYRDLYDDAWASYQVEIQKRLCGCWVGWANVGYSHETGKSCGCGLGDSTNFTYVPVSFGVNREFKLFCLDFYLGAGLNVSFARARDRSIVASGIDREWGVGAVVKSGFKYDLFCNTYLNVFADYYYTKFEHMFEPTHVQVRNNSFNAIIVGAGLGYRF